MQQYLALIRSVQVNYLTIQQNLAYRDLIIIVLVIQHFPDGIFWFRVGIIESKEKLLNRLKILCEKLDAHNVPTSIEHAQEILRRYILRESIRQAFTQEGQIIFKRPCLDTMQLLIKIKIIFRLFLSERYCKSLLVLCDVWSSDIPVTFSICCCRILLTTRDISILDPIPRHQTTVIEVPAGLKEKESLKVYI